MTGTEIEYLLGLYFLISSLTLVENNRLSADFIRLVAGILLLIMAFIGIAFVRS